MSFHPPGGGGGAASVTVGTSEFTGGTEGSVLFIGSGSVVQQDNANLFWDNTSNYLGLGTASPGAPLEIRKSAIGVTPTDGLLLKNATAATVGTQQFSPSIHLVGQGWKTTATAGSQAVDWIMQVAPETGTDIVDGVFEAKMALNGDAYVRTMYIGYAPTATVSGEGNTFIGYQSGIVNFSTSSLAYNNSFFGGETGVKNTTGYQNTYLGSRAGHENTTGFTNTGVGQGSLYHGTTATANVGVGFHSGLNATGGDSVFIGASAGAGALPATATGVGNTLVGFNSGFGFTTAAQNATLGRYALFALTTGSLNVSLGAQSGFSTTIGANNVYVGYQAGYTATAGNANVSGNNNTFVGYQSGPGSTTQISNAIALGQGALVSVSNTAVIGASTNTQVTAFGGLKMTGVAVATGTQKMLELTNATHTGQTASTEVNNISSSAYTRTWATGAITTQREISFGIPTYAFVGSSTITTAANVYIAGAPAAGTNAAITNAYALWVDAGTTQLDGDVNVGGTLTLTTDLTVTNGGTGVSSATAYAVICGGTTSTGAFQSVASVGTSGHVLTSNGAGALPTFQALPASGGLTWTEVTGTSQAGAITSGYITNNAALVTVTLPTTAALGSIIRIVGKGAGGWKVAQNASELIHFGNQVTTTGTGGSLASTNQYDALEILCTVADTEWTVMSSVGNITVV